MATATPTSTTTTPTFTRTFGKASRCRTLTTVTAAAQASAVHNPPSWTRTMTSTTSVSANEKLCERTSTTRLSDSTATKAARRRTTNHDGTDRPAVIMSRAAKGSARTVTATATASGRRSTDRRGCAGEDRSVRGTRLLGKGRGKDCAAEANSPSPLTGPAEKSRDTRRGQSVGRPAAASAEGPSGPADQAGPTNETRCIPTLHGIGHDASSGMAGLLLVRQSPRAGAERQSVRTAPGTLLPVTRSYKHRLSRSCDAQSRRDFASPKTDQKSLDRGRWDGWCGRCRSLPSHARHALPDARRAERHRRHRDVPPRPGRTGTVSDRRAV